MKQSFFARIRFCIHRITGWNGITLCIILLSQSALADTGVKPWYIAANAGIFQGNYDQIYNDTTDAIANNIRQTLQQYGYNGGIAFGYIQNLAHNYLIGAEASANITTNNANFASGTTSFSDQTKIQNYYDLVAVPGFYITDTVAAYLKGGLSLAYMKDSLNSPVTSTGVFITSNSHNYIWGVALGLGMKKIITREWAIYSEFQYHDYGTVNLPGFLNMAANYGHSAHVYSETLLLGVSYAF